MLKLEGKILRIFETKSMNGFDKRLFYLDDCAEKYRNIFALELWKKDCEMIDKYKVGDWVIAYIDIKGIYWSDTNGDTLAKNSLKCWNIEHNGVTYKPI
jgi:hypothetical protein